MPYIYATNGDKISLKLSADDIAVRFRGEAGPSIARAEVRRLRKAAKDGTRRTARALPGARATPVARYGRFLMMRDTGAARAPVATVVNALSKTSAAYVARTYPVYVDDDSGMRVVATEEITVRFKRGVGAVRIRKVLQRLDLTILRPGEFAPRQYIVSPETLRSGARAIDLANALLEADDVVEYAAPNFLTEHQKFAAPNDPLLLRQWHLENRGRAGGLAGEDVDAFQTWGVTRGDPGIVIAIIDDGVQTRHPDLAANIWRNPDPRAPDRHGRDFQDPDDPYDPNPKIFRAPYDDFEINDIHGTPCAGVAAAVGNNRRGVAGIAYRCTILPVKIFGGANFAPDDRVADAIRYAGQYADVLSCSWGVPRNPDIEAAIDDVVRTGRRGKGCAVFCAAGNDGRPRIGFPASHPRAFAVGASNDKGRRSKYSNYGQGIAFVAPSSDEDRGRPGITTTDVSKRNRGFALRSAYTDDFGGTSSATPLAAGVGALVLSVNPRLTWQQVRDILTSTADKIDPSGANYRAGYSPQYGYGRVNAHAAVLAARRRRTGRKPARGRQGGRGTRRRRTTRGS